MKTTKQGRIKVNMHQITALLLALLLIAATLSPALVVKADDDWTSAGAGNVAGSSSDDIFITETEDGSRILSFTQTIKIRYIKADDDVIFQYSFLMHGEGRFVIVSFMDRAHSGGADGLSVQSYLLSDETFTAKWKSSGNDYSNRPVTLYNGVAYVPLVGMVTQASLSSMEMSNVPNIHSVTLQSGETFEDIIRRYIDSGSIDLTNDNFRDLDLEKDGTYSKDIPTPKLSVRSDLSFSCDNSTDDYYLELQGRWWSVDDIELYKENAMWKYKYESYIKGSLNTWYSAGGKTKASSDDLSFLYGGQKYFDKFLTEHPVDERNYYGGTNFVGNYFSGYDNAISILKSFLKQPTGNYNGVEVYCRYYTYNDGKLIYGKWCHYTSSIVKNGSSGSEWDDDGTLHDGSQSEDGLTDDEKDDNEKKDDPREDPDLKDPSPDADSNEYLPDFTSIINVLKSLRSSGQGFLDLFFDVFNVCSLSHQ